jgi:hypothetical protein
MLLHRGQRLGCRLGGMVEPTVPLGGMLQRGPLDRMLEFLLPVLALLTTRGCPQVILSAPIRQIHHTHQASERNLSLK